MPVQQGSLELLQHPTSKQLLQSSIPARLAYVWTDGTPRVIPIWFHWNEREFVLGTVSTDVQSGLATVCYLPGIETPEREWDWCPGGIGGSNAAAPGRRRGADAKLSANPQLSQGIWPSFSVSPIAKQNED